MKFPVFAKATILCPSNRLPPVTHPWGKQIIRPEPALWIKEEQTCSYWAKNIHRSKAAQCLIVTLVPFHIRGNPENLNSLND